MMMTTMSCFNGTSGAAMFRAMLYRMMAVACGV